MKTPATLAIIGILAVLSSTAHAQDCKEDGAPVRNTVGHNLLFGAINTNAQVYGAANLLEEHLLPLLEVSDAAATYTVTATPGALYLPICKGAATELSAVDLSAGAFGAGLKTGPLTLFLSGSAAAHTLASPKLNERAVSPFLGAGFITGAPIGFFKRQFVLSGGKTSLTFDAMVGAHLDTEVGTLALAYVGTQGLYTNLSQKHIDAFVGLVFRQAADEVKQGTRDLSQGFLDDLPYLRAGFATLDWLVGDDARAWAGSTSLFARRLRYEGLAPTSFNRQETEDAQTEATNLSTVHVEQFKLLDTIDFKIAAAWEPEFLLHEASAGIALGQALPERVLVEQLTKDKIDAGDFFAGFRASIGVVQMPDIWYYGVEGGMRLRWSIDISMGGYDSGTKSYNIFFLSLGMNSAETLAVFPYARDAGFLNISGSFM